MDVGHSTPLLSGSRIFLTTFNEARKELATAAHDLEDGRELWRRPVAVTQIEAFHRTAGSAAQTTPACDGQRVYSFFGSYGLVCHDHQGNLIWQHRMGPFQDEYGSGSSPVLADGKLFILQDHDVDSFLMAFEAATGKVLWRVARPDAVRSYSTPVIWRNGSDTQLLVAGALELAAHNPETGQRLWWMNGLARIVIPAPVVSGNTIFMASWAPGGDAGRRVQLDAWSSALGNWDANSDGRLSRKEINNPEVLDRFFRMDIDQNGTLDQSEWERHARFFNQARNSVFAIRPGSVRGELDQEKVLWRNTRGVPYVSTPVVDSGILWMVKDGGIVTKLDVTTGSILQEERLPGGGSYFASPVAAGGKILFASEQGVLSIVANAREWKLISSHAFQERIHATPVVSSSGVLIRTDKALYRY